MGDTAGVIGVELQAEVWGVDAFQDRQCVIESVEFVIWNVEGVYRLDQEGLIGVGLCGPDQVLYECFQIAVYARHDVDVGNIECGGVGDCAG